MNFPHRFLLVYVFALSVFACDTVPSESHSDSVQTGARLHDVNVTRVKDGDSFIAVHNGNEIEVRLYGIDAPERKQPYAEASRKAALRMLDNKRITLVVQDKDRYGRLVAWAYLDHSPQSAYQPSLNQQLVENGAAWVYRRYTDDAGLVQAQHVAKKNKRGLWALDKKDRIEPWEWRAQNNR